VHVTVWWILNYSPPQYYRLFVIALLPSLHFLDYQHVKKFEHDRAKAAFGTPENPTPVFTAAMQYDADREIGAIPMRLNGTPAQGADRLKLSEKERKRIREMINEAESLREIARLEKILEDGRIPPGFFDEEDGMEE
jgi:U2 small nuclear ribonucleoprotein A'